MRIRNFLALLLSLVMVASLAIAPLGIVAENLLDAQQQTEQGAAGPINPESEPEGAAAREGMLPSGEQTTPPVNELATEDPVALQQSEAPAGEQTTPPVNELATEDPAALQQSEAPAGEQTTPPVNELATEDPAALQQSEAPAGEQTTPPVNELATEDPAALQQSEDPADEQTPPPSAPRMMMRMAVPQANPAPLTIEIKLDKDSVDLNEQVSAIITYSGGAMPYQTVTVSWVMFDGPQVVDSFTDHLPTSADSASSIFTPTAGRSGIVEVTILDANGVYTKSDLARFTIKGVNPECNIVLNKASVAVGEEIQAQVSLEGGKQPYNSVTYVWNVFEDKNLVSSNDRPAVNGLTRFTVPNYGTKGLLMMIVEDATGFVYNFTSDEFTITGAPPSVPLDIAITLDKTSVAVGETVNATWTVSGGTAPYEDFMVQCLVIRSDGNGKSVFINAKEDSASYTAVGGVKGQFIVSCRDAIGRSINRKSSEFTITGAPPYVKPTLTVTLDKLTVNAGDTITASPVFSGGTAPFTLTDGDWEIYDANNPTPSHIYLDNSTGLSLKATTGSRGYLNLTYHDALGEEVSFRSPEFTIIGGASLLAGKVMLDKESVQVGDSVTATWQITGGVAPYEILYGFWTISENEIGRGSPAILEGEASTIVPLYGDKCSMMLIIRDAEGRQVTLSSPTIPILGAEPVEPLKMSITLDKDRVSVGEPITGNWTITGGTPPYSVGGNWTVGEANIGEHEIEYLLGGTSSTITPLFGERGWLILSVTDSLGRSVDQEASFTIDGAVPVEPLEADVKLDKNTVAVGQNIKAAWEIRGGTPPYRSAVVWEVVEENGTQIFAKTEDTLVKSNSFTPSAGCEGNLYLTIWDALGRRIELYPPSFTITGAATADPLILDMQWSSDALTVGQPVIFNYTVSGGREPYVVKYATTISESNHNSYFDDGYEVTGGSITITPRFGDALALYLYVEDADGRSVGTETPPLPISNGVPQPLLTVKAMADQSTVAAGQPVTANWTIKGGKAPYQSAYQLNYITADGRTILGDRRAVTGNTLRVNPLYEGEACVLIYVKDADGRNVEAGLFLTVTAPAVTPFPVPPTARPTTPPLPTARPTTPPAPTARPTTPPAPTARPTTPPAPTARPTVQPTTQPTAYPTPLTVLTSPEPVVLTSLSTLVRNERSQSVPFVATQQTALNGQKKLIITAQILPVTQGTPEEQEDTTIYWDFTPDFIAEAQALGATTVSAATQEISIEIGLDELKAAPAQQAVLSLEQVQEKDFSASLQKLMPTLVRKTEVYTLNVGSRAANAPVEIELTIPYDVQVAYQIVELRPDGQILYSEVTNLMVQEGMIHLKGTVQNGSTFFLAQK